MRILFLLALFIAPCIANAQLGFAYIDSISVQGNKKTKESIILREMLVRAGDTVSLAELA